MINNDDVITMIRKNYPDITEENATYLARRTLAWLTVVGNTAEKRIASTKESGISEWETRAIILATSVVARMLSGFAKDQSEVDSLNNLVDWLLTLNNEPVNTL